MRKAALALLVLAAICLAGQRKVVKRVVVADTVVTVKVDTIKTVKYDTLLVRQIVQDSSWVVKADTVKASEAAKQKPKAKGEKELETAPKQDKKKK